MLGGTSETIERGKLALVKNRKMREALYRDRKEGGDRQTKGKTGRESKTRILTAFDPRPMGGTFFFFSLFFIDEGFS